MNIENATKIANEFVLEQDPECIIDINNIIEFEFEFEFEYGYCFIWNTKHYYQTLDINDMVIGPGPFVVPKNGDPVYIVGSYMSQENLVTDFIDTHEEKNNTYSIWHSGELKSKNLIREKYNITIRDLYGISKGNQPILSGSLARLQNEAEYLKKLGNHVEIRKI